MEAAKRMLGSHPDKAAELLQNAITISKEGIEDIRITLKNMKPPAEQMGIHRLRTFIDEFSAKNGMLGSVYASRRFGQADANALESHSGKRNRSFDQCDEIRRCHADFH